MNAFMTSHLSFVSRQFLKFPAKFMKSMISSSEAERLPEMLQMLLPFSKSIVDLDGNLERNTA